MSNLSLDLANSTNWEQIHYSSRSVEFTSSTNYKPLEDIQVNPLLMSSPIVATFANTSDQYAKPSWYTAGWMYQLIQTGIQGSTASASEVSTRSLRVPLNRIKLHILGNNYSNYGLVFKSIKWVRQLSLTAWAYTGEYATSLEEKVDLTRIDVLRVEAMVKNLQQF